MTKLTGKKYYSCDDEVFRNEDPEQCAYDEIFGEGREIAVVYEGETYETDDECILELVRDECGEDALPVGRVREYARYVKDGGWVKEVES